ncbi:unnamed protein product [Rhizophagus irregularis]|nr:unnamed protein product [Rhizophagus irregularis]
MIRKGRTIGKGENDRIGKGEKASASGPWALLGFGFSWIGFGFGIWAFDRYWLLYPWTLDMYRLLCLLPNSRFFNVDGKCFGIEKQKMKYYICRPKIVHCILVLNILYT